MNNRRYFKLLTTVCFALLLAQLLVGSSTSTFRSGSELNQQTANLVRELESTFPETSSKGKNKDMFYKSIKILKGLMTGSIKPVQVVQNVKHIDQIHQALRDPTLIAIIADKVPLERKSFDDPLFKLDEDEVSDDSLLHRLFLPYMNNLGQAVSKSRKNLMYSTTLTRLPSHLAKRDLMAIYDVGNGVLMIHGAFFKAMRSRELLDLIPVAKIEEMFERMMADIPSSAVTTDQLAKSIMKVPDMMIELANPTALCLACMSVLNIVFPFILNYLCYYLAQIFCVLWKLPQDQCTQMEASSLLVAFALVFPAALVIWKICHITVCSKKASLIYRVGVVTTGSMLTFLKSVFNM